MAQPHVPVDTEVTIPRCAAGWVSDGSTVVEIPAGTVVTVTRARVTSTHGGHRHSGYAEVAMPSGQRVKVDRASFWA